MYSSSSCKLLKVQVRDLVVQSSTSQTVHLRCSQRLWLFPVWFAAMFQLQISADFSEAVLFSVQFVLSGVSRKVIDSQ